LLARTKQTKKITDAESKTMLKTAYDKLISISKSIEGIADTTIVEQGKAAEPPKPESAIYVEAEKADKEKQEPTLPSDEEKGQNLALYEGNIEIAIPPPVGLDRMLQFHKHLKQTPQLEVLNLGGSVDKGITIRLHLESPIPLLKILEDLPEVKKASDELPGERVIPGRGGGEDPSLKRVVVITKE
jgi:hypothetical protein